MKRISAKYWAAALLPALLWPLFTGSGMPLAAVSFPAESAREPAPLVVVQATGTVKAASLRELTLAFGDGSERTLGAEGLPGLSGIRLGDIVTLSYVERDGIPTVESLRLAGTGEEDASAAAPETFDEPGEGEPAAPSSGPAQRERALEIMEALCPGLEILDWTRHCSSVGTTGHPDVAGFYAEGEREGELILIGRLSSDDAEQADREKATELARRYGYRVERSEEGEYLHTRTEMRLFNDIRGIPTDETLFFGVPPYEPWREPGPELGPRPEPEVEPAPGIEAVPTPAPEPAAAPGEGAPLAYAAIRLVNAERAAAGLLELTVDGKAMTAAQIRAGECASLGSLRYNGVPHVRPDGSSWSTVIYDAGISCRVVAENLGATTVPDAARVVRNWMNSPSHKANILDTAVTKIGVGWVETATHSYWALIAYT